MIIFIVIDEDNLEDDFNLRKLLNNTRLAAVGR